MTHDELQKVRNALAVATTHFARDRNVVLDAIVILNNALAEPPQRTWVGLTDEEIEEIKLKAGSNVFSAIMFTNDRLEEKNT